MNIRIKGAVLVLNTIDHLETNKKVWVSHESLIFTEAADAYLYKKAQFVAEPSFSNGYVIPLKKDEDGTLVLDFIEVRFAFNIMQSKELSKVDLDEYWHIGTVELEKQKDARDWIRRGILNELFESFAECFLSEAYPMENLTCIKDTLIERLRECENRVTVEEILAFCRNDFKNQLVVNEEVPEHLIEETKTKFCKRIDTVNPFFEEIAMAAEIRLAALPQEVETEASMQEKLDAALTIEDYVKAVEIRNEMKEKGFTPKS